MSSLREISDRAVADFGFRQAVMWNPDDVAERWNLSDKEREVLNDVLGPELEALPNPVEPEDVPTQQTLVGGIVENALSE